MLPASSFSLKAARDSQRTRSLGLSAKSRLAHLSRAPSFALSCKKVDSRRAGPCPSANTLKAECVIEARAEVEENKLERSEERERESGGRGGAREVLLEELVCVKRSWGLTGEFEIIPRFKAVIALGDDEFEPAVRDGDALTSAEEDDDWEVVEAESPKVVKEVRSWSSVVSRRN